jgi:uncharacterized membrane protein
MGVLIVYLFFAIIVGVIGDTRTLGFWGAFLLSLVLTPVVGLIICILYPDKAAAAKRLKDANRGTVSIADELTKIAQLRADNLITDREYQRLRNNLIN